MSHPDSDRGQGAEPRAWPSHVPDALGAWMILAGKNASAIEYQEFTAEFLRTIPESVSAMLLHPQNAAEQTIQNAIVMDWRLRAALLVKPKYTAPIDPSGVDALLKAADENLSAIRQIDIVPDFLTTLRSSIAKNSVGISDFLQKSREHESKMAKDALAAKREMNREARAQKAAETVVENESKKTSVPTLPLILGVSILLAGIFHGYRFWIAQNAKSDFTPPFGQVLTPANPARPKTLLLKENEKLPSESEIEALRLKLEKEGHGKLIRLSEREFAVIPTSTAAPF